MKKIMEKIKLHKVACVVKYVFVLVAAASVIYGLGYKPMMDQGKRVACHVATATDARTLGENVAEQNKDNEELTDAEKNQQINSLVNQTYETNYVLCLRNNGL